MPRIQPNIIITGTPGVGKTSHCNALAANTGLKLLSVNQIVKERTCHDGWDEELKSWIVDEDKVRLIINSEDARANEHASYWTHWKMSFLREAT